MPVGLSPLTAPQIKSKSIAISTSYLNLSMVLAGRQTLPMAAAHLPTTPQPISVSSR